MATMALTLPLARRSLTCIPCRDLAMAAGDGFVLQLTLVAADRPDAAPLSIAGLGAQVRLMVWRYRPGCGCGDYGPRYRSGTAGVMTATIVDGPAGRADIMIPASATAGWAGRLGWQVQLEYNGDVSVIVHGVLQVRPSPSLTGTTMDLLADDGLTQLTDDTFSPIEV